MYFVKEVKSSYIPYTHSNDTPLISISKMIDFDIVVSLENLEDKSTIEIIGFDELVKFYTEQDCHVVGLYKKSPIVFEVELYDREEARVMQYLRFRFSRTMESCMNYSYNLLHYIMLELQMGVEIGDHFYDESLYVKPKEIRFKSSREMLKFDFTDKQAFTRQLTKLMVLRKNESFVEYDNGVVSYCQADANTIFNLYQRLSKLEMICT